MSSFLDLDSPVVRVPRSRYSRLTDSVNISQHATINSTLDQPSPSASSAFNSTLVAAASTLHENTIGTPHCLRNISINAGASILSPNISTLMQQINDDQPLVADEPSERLVIYQTFFDHVRNANITSLDDVLKLAEMFDDKCEQNYMVAAEIITKSVRPKDEIQYYTKFSQLLRLERDTWRLFRAILGDRIYAKANAVDISADDDNDFDDALDDLKLTLSDKELVERSMGRVSSIREMQVVIDWLESIYEEVTDGDMTHMLNLNGPHYWENTLHELKQGSRPSGARKLCLQMDPDASLRTGLPLHDVDREDENRLFHFIFKLIRGGRLMEGKEIAEKWGFFWLSSAMEGWILAHDPNYKTKPDFDFDSMVAAPTSVAELEPLEGNPNRDLWKFAAWCSSKLEDTNMYERAIFAVFSGNRSALLPLCSSWHDKLWAYFKCSLDVHIENILVESNVSRPDLTPRSNIDLAEAYWNSKLSVDDIFNELESIGTSVLTEGFHCRTEEKYHRIIQKLLMLGQIDKLLLQVYDWAKAIQDRRETRSKKDKVSLHKLCPEDTDEVVNVVEPNLLRFFAHLMMLLNHLELVPIGHETLVAQVVEFYIAYLIEEQLVELVAHYTAQLCEAKQVKTFATLLEAIEEPDDRKTCLLIAKTEKLNIAAILAIVVDNIRLDAIGYQTMLADRANEAGSNAAAARRAQLMLPKVDKTDLRKVAALDWLTINIEPEGGDTRLWMELLWQGTALVRTFLLERKHELAELTFGKLPNDIMVESFANWQAQPLLLRKAVDIDNLVREYFCHKAYFEAHKAFQEWHHFLYSTKPKEPIRVKVFARLADRVAHEQACKQYEQDMEQWRRQVAQQAKIAADSLLAFLTFPERVWRDVAGLKMLADTIGAVGGGGGMVDDDDDADIVSHTEGGDEVEEDIPTVQATVASDTEMEVETIGLEEAEDDVLKQLVARKFEAARQRKVQLEGLRRLYLPQFCLLLHSIHHESGDPASALRVADIVADPSAALFEAFSKEELKDFLGRIRETSIEVLNHCCDPLGYTH